MANGFAVTIPERLDKTMLSVRAPSGGREVVVWHADDEGREAGWVAQMILDLVDQGVAYPDIAVLVRGRASYGRADRRL